MATPEKSGFNLLVEFTYDDNGTPTTIEFCCKSKTPFGMEASSKIDVNCDRAGKYKGFASAEQVEITDATLTLIYDQVLLNELSLLIGTAGSLVIESSYTGKKTTNANCWVKSAKPGAIDLEGTPTMDVVFESGGGLTGVPVVEDVTT